MSVTSYKIESLFLCQNNLMLVSFVRYFLSETVAPSKSSNQSIDAAKEQQLAAKEAEKTKKLAEQAEKNRLAEESRRVAAEKRAADLAAKKEQEAKSKREQEAKAKQAAKKREAQARVSQAKKSSTISLFGLGQGSDVSTTSSPVVPAKKSPTLNVKQSPSQMIQKPVAPKGMPTISGWKLNGDGTISGRITGSPNFKQGELITTSQIKNGRIESGSVVQTGSGSKYFLG